MPKYYVVAPFNKWKKRHETKSKNAAFAYRAKFYAQGKTGKRNRLIVVSSNGRILRQR